jgi:hypothetical protein
MEETVKEAFTYRKQNDILDEDFALFKLDTDGKAVLENVEQRVSINIKRFKEIKKKDNVKKYGLNWKNDKRQIDYMSDVNHIRTKPLYEKGKEFDMMNSFVEVFGKDKSELETPSKEKSYNDGINLNEIKTVN